MPRPSVDVVPLQGGAKRASDGWPAERLFSPFTSYSTPTGGQRTDQAPSVLARSSIESILGCPSDESFEHPEVTLVHEVLRPAISRDGHDAAADHLDTDGLLNGTTVEDSKTLMSVVRRYAIGLCTTEDPLSAEMLDRSVLAHPLEGIG